MRRMIAAGIASLLLMLSASTVFSAAQKEAKVGAFDFEEKTVLLNSGYGMIGINEYE